ncbi:hypothetical protein PFISCL1PPCAC_5672 [Pristionchus fissidentatus]|uniref:MARVEL domain-containing protein n=1 Tax=Pristionchus fissidentatus TaxID=1538716 RepID=A0AAV5V461_9BILA|nr:hypothetical protein PFISCL1PPCAC_5672 [Pristionchus fissidentatus]
MKNPPNKCLISTLLTFQLMLSAIYAAELATNLNRDGSHISKESVRTMITFAFVTSAIWFGLTAVSLCGLVINRIYLLIPHLIYTIFLIIFTFGSLAVLIISQAPVWPHILASITGVLLSISIIEHFKIVISIHNYSKNGSRDECMMRVIGEK